MAIVNVKSMWSRVNGSSEANNYTFSLFYSVLVDSMLALPDEVLTAAGIPVYGDDWPGSSLTFKPKCIRTRVVDRQGLLYIVEAEYGATPLSVVTIDFDNPLLDTPRILAWETVTIEEECDVDLDKKPLLNSAGVPVRGLRRERSDTIFRITVNVASFNNAFAKAYRNTINSDTFLGNAPGTVKINRIDAGQKQTRNNIEYYPVTIEFQETVWPEAYLPIDSNYMAWDWHYLSMGTTQLINGELHEIVYPKQKTPVSEPQLLDGVGAVIWDAVAHPERIDRRHRKRYPRMPFETLGLGGAV